MTKDQIDASGAPHSCIRRSPSNMLALARACKRLQSFLDTFGDLGDCETQADLNDWAALAAKPTAEVGLSITDEMVAVNNHDALVKALTDTLCELTACANQLAARGLKGREGDSVSRAQLAARAALANAKASGQSDDR